MSSNISFGGTIVSVFTVSATRSFIGLIKESTFVRSVSVVVLIGRETVFLLGKSCPWTIRLPRSKMVRKIIEYCLIVCKASKRLFCSFGLVFETFKNKHIFWGTFF